MSWKEIISTLAPSVATALGGPLAGLATTKLLGVLGLKDNANDDDILNALQNPDALLKIKELEQNFKIEMRKLDNVAEKIHMQDRNSARKRETVIQDKTPAILASFITFGFFGAVYIVMTGLMPSNIDKIIVGSLLGTLGTAWIAVVSYYFGSSIGSKKKDYIIKQSK